MKTMTFTAGKPLALIVAFGTLLSWMGEVIHNRVELPGLTIISPENSIMGLIALLLYLFWRFIPSKLSSGLLLALALLHLFGGAVFSVIPFPFLPFYPEQSLGHYLTHAFYGLAQLPLIFLMLREIRRPSVDPQGFR